MTVNLLTMIRLDISPQHLYILTTPGKTLSSYARDAGISSAAMTGTADRLEKRGLVTRGPCPSGDRTKLILTPTEEGLRVAAECQQVTEDSQ